MTRRSRALTASACWLFLGASCSYWSVEALITGEIREPSVDAWLMPTHSRATEPVEFWSWFGLFVAASALMLGLGLYSLYRIYRMSSDKSLGPDEVSPGGAEEA